MTSKIRKLQDGQAKSQAKGVGRKLPVTKGMGLAIAEAMKGATVRERILELLSYNLPTQENALAELIVASKKQQSEVTSTGLTRKRALKVIQASFSRVKTIVQAIIDRYNVDKIRKAKSLDEMYAVSVQRSNKRKPGKSKPFTADQFKEWDERGIRKLSMEIPNTKTASASDLEKYADNLNRLERHFVNVLALLAKHEHQSTIPARQMLGMVQKRKAHLRKAA